MYRGLLPIYYLSQLDVVGDGKGRADLGTFGLEFSRVPLEDCIALEHNWTRICKAAVTSKESRHTQNYGSHVRVRGLAFACHTPLKAFSV